jgi:hypothetical protein
MAELADSTEWEELQRQAKIAQCRYVRDVELPRFSSFMLFHTWLESP